MYLYPYDLLRLKQNLGLSSDALLQRYTVAAFRDNPHFPHLMLQMSDNQRRTCPFLSREGCRVYADRPYACRAYPLERAVVRGIIALAGEERPARYSIAHHTHCQGHQEKTQFTAASWIDDQELAPYHFHNDLWVDLDTLFRRNPWGSEGINSPAMKMAFMACYNVDTFRNFVFTSSFLERFSIEETKVAQLNESDEALLQFGFEWIRFFLTGKGPLQSETKAKRQ
jgi:Fe-S-cluster containining protein